MACVQNASHAEVLPAWLQAAKHAARALHICPWGVPHQAALCKSALDASAHAAAAVAHLSQAYGLVGLCEATQGYGALTDDQLPAMAIQEMVAAGVTGLVVQPCAMSGLPTAQQNFKVGLS